MSEETRFGIEFVVTRNGEPITRVIAVHGLPITLHERHVKTDVWAMQVKVLTELLRSRLNDVDALAGVVPDARPVGLPVPQNHPVIERAGVAVLKPVNRFLAWLVRRLNGV